MHSSEMIENSCRDCCGKTSVLPPAFSSSVRHFISEVFSRHVSVSVLVKLAMILTSIAAAPALLLKVAWMAILMVSVMWRLVLIPFREVMLTVSIMCWWRGTSLIIVVAWIIFLKVCWALVLFKRSQRNAVCKISVSNLHRMSRHARRQLRSLIAILSADLWTIIWRSLLCIYRNARTRIVQMAAISIDMCCEFDRGWMLQLTSNVCWLRWIW